MPPVDLIYTVEISNDFENMGGDPGRSECSVDLLGRRRGAGRADAKGDGPRHSTDRRRQRTGLTVCTRQGAECKVARRRVWR